MERIKIVRKPRLKNPYLIVAWPGMGEVAIRSADYLVDKLKAEEFASMPAEDFFYLSESTVRSGIISLSELPQGRFYFWKNKSGDNDLVIFISDAQPDLAKAEEYSSLIIKLARELKVSSIVSFAAMPQPIDHNQDPGVWFAATSERINQSLKSFELQKLSEGQVSGMNGLFLGMAKREGFEGFCLLAEIPLYTIQIENPKAALCVLRAFSRIAGIGLDFSELSEQIRQTEEQINNLLEYFKLGPSSSPGPIGEEEIDKIKKTLSQLTRLPISVKDKIEKLFAQATCDIAKARELKSELDKWNVYKEYEDRFLDLFKKGEREKNN